MSSFLTYAFNTDHLLVHVDTVPLGDACGCVCPNCNAPLCAKNQGKVKEHHFAHAHGHVECENACETTLHLLAKQIFQENPTIMLPLENDNRRTSRIQLKDVQIEQYDAKHNIRPDAEGIMPNGERLLVEFAVTHKVDTRKYDTIIDNNLRCVEIDLRYFPLDKQKLFHHISNSTNDRKWIVKREKSDSLSLGSLNHNDSPQIDFAKNIIRNHFDSKTLYVRNFQESSQHFNLAALGYDACEENADYNGFHCDLLLSRSAKKDKGHIAINFRSRRRNQNAHIPPDLRMIDIIIIKGEPNPKLKSRFESGLLCDYYNNVFFIGKWENKLRNQRSERVLKFYGELHYKEALEKMKMITIE